MLRLVGNGNFARCANIPTLGAPVASSRILGRVAGIGLTAASEKPSGFRLFSAARSVAALTAPRAVIHYRSPSIPVRVTLNHKKTGVPKYYGNFARCANIPTLAIGSQAAAAPRGVCEPNSGRFAPRVGLCAKRISKTKGHSQGVSFCFGDPYGNRTHVFAVKGRCLSRLTNGP